MISWDFTLQKYSAVCKTLLGCQYRIVTVCGFLLTREIVLEDIVILRHDVDRWPQNALNMALLEKELGVRATYYFRKKQIVSQGGVIRKIADLGHEIGYHYETLVDLQGNYDRAIDEFRKNLAQLRLISDIRTICMHGSPFSRLNNAALWKVFRMSDFDIIGDAYLSIDYSRVGYLTDTGRSWHSAVFNLRDYAPSARRFFIRDTDDLIRLLERREVKALCIQIHPERWASNFLEYVRSLSFDIVSNVMKLFIKLLRA